MEPLPLNPARIAARFSEPKVKTALAEVGIASPAALLATWVTDRDGLARFSGPTPAVTDDRPAIEYATWVRPREVARTLPALLSERSQPPLGSMDSSLMQEIDRERGVLDVFYQSALAAYEGDRDGWARNGARLAAASRDNPYLRWFTGGKAD
ncbi:hypothetical protein G6F57_019651 [Rhizopus arrhizus]|nr:hypothetical protein G6F57_019651 [Rhizopus arrhizus]